MTNLEDADKDLVTLHSLYEHKPEIWRKIRNKPEAEELVKCIFAQDV